MNLLYTYLNPVSVVSCKDPVSNSATPAAVIVRSPLAILDSTSFSTNSLNVLALAPLPTLPNADIAILFITPLLANTFLKP